MKKALIVLSIIFSLTFSQKVYAATSPTTSPSETKELQTIQRIKDMVASKVAELNLVDKRGLFGEVTDVANTQVKIKNIKGETQIIDIDELTEFTGNSSSTSFGITDIQKGDRMSFVGLYNKDREHLLARFVKVAPVMPVSFDGVIAAKDSTNYNFTMYNADGDKKIIDIETSTKTTDYSPKEGLTKSGFSKTDPGVRAIVTGFLDKQDNTHIIADRILVLNDVPLTDSMKQHISDTKSSPTPSVKK